MIIYQWNYKPPERQQGRYLETGRHSGKLRITSQISVSSHVGMTEARLTLLTLNNFTKGPRHMKQWFQT